MAAIRSGHGSSLTMSTSGWTASYTNISGIEQTLEALDTSNLSTSTYRSKIKGDLIDPGEFTATFLYDADEQPPITSDPEQVQLIFPAPSGFDGARIQGQGFVSSWSSPEAVTDTIMSATVTITWAGSVSYQDETET